MPKRKTIRIKDTLLQQKHGINGDEMIVDFHSHILPAIDDGSRSVQESAEMLRIMERYYPLQHDLLSFQAMLQLPLYIQLNAETFGSFRMRRIAFKIIDFGKPILLGSDCHNIKERYPNLPVGRKALQKKYGESFLSDMDSLGDILLSTDSYTEERET